jgi:hypothetical protein
MTDRELLEAAAKAAGLDLATWDEESGCMNYQFRSPLTNMHLWNPLADDGDALRLAVKLEIRVEPMSIWCVAYSGSVCADQFSERVKDDACAATRRAIVRAAAALAEKP